MSQPCSVTCGGDGCAECRPDLFAQNDTLPRFIANVIATMRSCRATRLAVVWLEDDAISVCNRNGLPYLDIKGRWARGDAVTVAKALKAAGIRRVSVREVQPVPGASPWTVTREEDA